MAGKAVRGHGPGKGQGQGQGDGPGGSGEVSEEAWDELVLDEGFIRSAGTAEPSARARMLAARWRDEAPEPQPWRSDEPPAGWFFSRSRRRWWRRK
ncbi:SGM_3592 family protein [Streptomyces turgidiscabies]|uniref:Uncharacterized protein n=1 Tax=Streptomyces turgidiscabies TaxID=85558 RepID=A0ABU0RQB6_9ACTN|nr:hypothetical protein [Streptomyces turgidiscabies]MDQ0933963.1 hypothetical protein [Streptomyces turgidiscabies]